MSQVNKINYGCNLQIGTLLLLWIFAIFCGFSVVVDVYYMSAGSQSRIEEFPWDNFKSTIAFVYKLSVFTVAVVGLYGIHRNKPKYFTIFYYFNYFQLFLISIFIVYLFIDPIEHGKIILSRSDIIAEDRNRTILLTLLLLCGLAFQIYFIVVVKNYYEMMRERSSSRTHILIFAQPDNYGIV